MPDNDQGSLVSVIGGTIALRKTGSNGPFFIVSFKSERDQFIVHQARGRLPVDIWAITDATLCVIDLNALESERESDRIHRRLLELFQGELAAAQDALFRLGRMSAIERVASFISEMAARHGHPSSDGIRCRLPMSRSDIGDHLGLKTETVSRSLGVLKAGGMVRFLNRNDVLIRDVRLLRALADGFEIDG